jgi:putative heme-binding domain-containing protein
MKRQALFLFALLGLAPLAGAQTPEWLWFQKTDDTDVRFFRKAFAVDGKVSKAELVATADDELEVFVNGESVLKNSRWQESTRADIAAKLRTGQNVLAIRATNRGSSAAGALVKLDIATEKGPIAIVTDKSWKASVRSEAGWNKADFNDTTWTAAQSLGKLGVAPWGDVLASTRPTSAGTRGPARREAPPAESLYALPGFKVELIASAAPEEGSWVAMTKDDQGRLIISPQWPKASSPEEENARGLLCVTVGTNGKVGRRELFAKSFYDSQGLVFHQKSIYAVVNKYSTKFESGLYRLRDTSGNDKFEDIELLKKIPGNGEHGPHYVQPGSDGNLYVMAGNHTKLVSDVAPNSPHKNYAEDHVLPRQWDANGHAAGILAPGGHIYRVSPDGKSWELFCGGFRNQYGFAFNADNEIFVYDSDMEWEWGTHWYRPTRVYHMTSAADVGWRSGSAKWPGYYPDATPPVLDVGVGCPTGTAFGYGAKFPAKYQRAYYILDWTYGRVIAVHLTPNGASYTATMENLVCPLGLMQPGAEKRPLNVTDLIVGQDGALYFTVGGRGVQSGLYRVTYTGRENTAHAKLTDSKGSEARKLRRQLEAFHGREDARAVDLAWKHLNSDDRAIRYAARVAIEAQPIAQWKYRALEEKKVNAGLTALLALARVGGKESQDDCLRALSKFSLSSLKEDKQLEKLRVTGLSFARHGRPSAEVVKLAVEELSARFPSGSYNLNQEIVQLLVFLEAPGVAGKALTLLDAAPTQEQQFAYLFHLRTLATGWSPEQRTRYFTALNSYPNAQAKHEGQTVKWFTDAGRDYADGNSFRKQLDKIRDDAVGTLTDLEKTKLAGLISVRSAGPTAPARNTLPAPKQRAFVNEWKSADFASLLDQAKTGRDYTKGRQAYVDAQCHLCHKMGNEGGGIGPELTTIAARFSTRDILDSILEPSKVVSEQFQNTTVVLKNGDDLTGRLMDETPEHLVLVPNQLQPDSKVTVKKSEMAKRSFSKLSPMPEALANSLSKEDILDLLAFLEAAGRRDHAAFKK